MTTLSEHIYTARVLDAGGDVALSLDEDQQGWIGLDSSGIPHVEGSLTVAVEDPMLLDRLDPRDGRRVVIDVTGKLPGGTVSRTFNLGIREATPDRAQGKVTLRLASDEALLMDYAQLVDDNGPRGFESSLRAVCEYVLGRVSGIAPNRAQSPRGTSAGPWSASQSAAGTPSLAPASTPGMNVGGVGLDTFLRAEATAASTYLDIRGTAANNILAEPLGTAITISAWVRPSSIGTPLGRVYVQQYDAAGVLLGTSDVSAAAPSGVWSRVSLTVARLPFAVRVVPIFRVTGTVPVGARLDATGFVTEQASVVGPYRDRVLTPGADDADVTAYWPLTNLAVNPAARVDAAGWVAGSGATGVARFVSPTIFGLPTIRYTATGAGNAFLNTPAQDVRVTPGRIITASVYLASASTSRPARIMLRFKDQSGATILDSYSDPVNTSTTTDAPTRISRSRRVPPNATTVSVYVNTTVNAANQNHYVSAMMLHEGAELVPFFDGSTTNGGGYTFAYEDAPYTSTSTRTPNVERDPESLVWRAGVSGMEFLHPLLLASGLRLVCDERRGWSLRPANYRAVGDQVYRHGVNIETADEQLSRDGEDWFDAAVYEYTWTDKDGIAQRRLDAFALTANPTKVLRVEVTNTPYPGPGRAENVVRRAQGRGRTVTVSAIPTWTERPDQTISVLLEGTPIQTGIAGSIRFDLSEDTVTATSRTTDTPAGAWVLRPSTQRWIDVPSTETWIGAS
ncbi:hypothetical protein [Microbacterium sp. NPDC057658]|uniref:hypothetical protein n=1 Tax=unclassified Microbacterium TaxID=2609290 RepID=UPI0036718119